MFRQGTVPVAVARTSAYGVVGRDDEIQAGRFQLWIADQDHSTGLEEADERDFAALLSEIKKESGTALGAFLLFFQKAGALANFKGQIAGLAAELPLAGGSQPSGITWSVVTHIMDQSGEYHLVEGKLAASSAFELHLDVVELGSNQALPVEPTILFKERREAASARLRDEGQNQGEVAFCAVWRAEPSAADRVWLLQVKLKDGPEAIDLPIACLCDRCNDRDFSRDVVKILLDEWRVDEAAGWHVAEFVSGCRANRFRNRIVRTEVFKFGLERPVKRSVVIYLSRMTALVGVNIFMSEFVVSPAQDTELVILVVGKQAWSDLFERCLSKIEGICPNPIRVIYSQGSVPAAMALAGIVKSLKSEAVLLLPAEFSWPVFDPLFDALEGSDGVLLLEPVPDWCARETQLTQKSPLESFIFSQRTLLGRQRRRPVLAERRKLISILTKLPVFLRDEMFYEELGQYLEGSRAATLQAVGCFQVEAPVPLSRVEMVANQLIALQHRRLTRS